MSMQRFGGYAGADGLDISKVGTFIDFRGWVPWYKGFHGLVKVLDL